MIPTQLKFARLQQTLGNRAMASAPRMQSGDARSAFTLGGGGFGGGRFGGGGSTFTGATPPSWLSGFSGLASPEEWKTQGTAFTQNPQMLQNRANMEQFGRQYEFDKLKMGDPTQAGQRAYTFGREEDELNRLRMAAEGMKLQSQMAYQPQFDSLRSTMMDRMGKRFGVSMPKPQTPYSSGTGYTPSWMRSYQVPQFPNR
jgi:hypothetical protein